MSTRRKLSLLALLALIWWLLSGHTEPLIIGFGVASVILVVFVANRMEILDEEGHPIELIPGLIRYAPWLGREIVLSNIAVIRCILDPDMPIRPQLFRTAADQSTDVGKVIFANSITLTPGTVSLDVDEETIEVHALTEATAQDLESGTMNRKVSKL